MGALPENEALSSAFLPLVFFVGLTAKCHFADGHNEISGQDKWPHGKIGVPAHSIIRLCIADIPFCRPLLFWSTSKNQLRDQNVFNTFSYNLGR
jgi:hypothetical protein